MTNESVCNKCGVNYIPYGDGQGGQRDVAACFVCFDCYYKAACEMAPLQDRAGELKESGVHPKMIDRIMSNKTKKEII